MEGATIRMAATVGLWLDDVLPVNYKSPLTGTTLSAPALTSLPTGYTRSGTEMAVSGGVAATARTAKMNIGGPHFLQFGL
jgi:hypothetical protein